MIAGDTEFCIACGCAITQQQAVEMEYEVDQSATFYKLSQMPWFLLAGAAAAAVGILGWIALAFSTTKESGYAVAGLGQMNWGEFWKRTDTSMSEIWLNGFTTNREPAKQLAALARSWQHATR